MTTHRAGIILAAVLCLALIGGAIATAEEEAKPQGEEPAENDAKKQDADQLALDVSDAQKANVAAIATYTWRVKSSIAVEGETKATSITEMRFDSEGKLESTHIGGESSVKKKPGLRGRRQQKKMEEFADYLQGVLEHSFNYIFLSKGTLVDVFDRAKITESEDGIDISAVNLFVDADSLFMSVRPETKLPRQLVFYTTLEDDAIDGTVKMHTLEDGPSTPEHIQFDIPTQNIVITSETYDWIAQKVSKD